jgi:hypothetical protein
MSATAHRIYLFFFVAVTLITLVYFAYNGFTYYNTSLEERFFNPDHEVLKPSGPIGHGLGIIGSLIILTGVFTYMIRKRNRSLMRLGILKHWLEFHIFMCTLGPIMILYHTAFKFGGLVSVSFWSMVAVFLSGIAGRFIYLQIPRSIEGRELSLSEIKGMKSDIGDILSGNFNIDPESYSLIIDSTKKKVELYQSNFIIRIFRNYREDRKAIRTVKSALKKNNVPSEHKKQILKLVNHEISINRRIERLVTMQNLFKYWHVAHLPFALVMLVIMIIHVIVTVVFGFRWIF